ncbi:Sec-independent protein translocase subunit TatA/TatB [Plebeiibacterium marinum]|uniref:Sec-independent protein translocase protein TatA n=1 Tax=Plebeiibacterium marinum TaxID=2992111 RepID=A0AAE3MHD4_9BACT|nr:twin-arginine translocase TatA/TatE family subunit [Plebeiobacterium marinum]MCW3807868.1 twin-arginine translocase TatA/TatE family subunit [Plebeiobacterium marinum]
MLFNSVYICGFLGGYEWIVIILAIVLLFGGRKIPELMKGLGQGMKEFKKAKKDIDKELKDDDSKE